MKYEYKVLYQVVGINTLNKMGKKRWELVSVAFIPSVGIAAYFRRELTD